MSIIRYLTVGSDETGTIERVALTALFLFALLAYLAPHAAMAACFVLLGATFAHPRAAIRECARDPLLMVFLVFSAYVLTRAGFAAAEFPSLIQEQVEMGVRAGVPVLLLPVAWWLRGDLTRVFALLLVALGAFCVDMLIEFKWHLLPELLLTSLRDGINGRGLATALYTGTGILGLIAFGPRLLRRARSMGPGAKVLVVSLWSIVMGLLLFAQYITLTRSVIMSLTILIPILAVVTWWPYRRRRLGPGTWLLLGSALLALGGIGAASYGHMENRLAQAGDVLAHASRGNLSEVPTNSLGIRIHLWDYATELIAERPVFGWGPGTRAVRSVAEEHDRLLFTNYGDLHNEWVQMTFWFGFTGLLLYGALLFLLFRAGIRSYRAGAMPRDMFLFLTASMVLLAGWTVINSRLLDLDFQYYLILMLGTMYTFHLKAVGRQPPDPPQTAEP